MFTRRSDKKELIDTDQISQAELIKNLKEFVIINRWLGSHTALIKALNYLYSKNVIKFKNKTLSIADLGCGAGDLLKATHIWSLQKEINANLQGFDLNLDIINYAKVNTKEIPSIQYVHSDIFKKNFNDNFDIIFLNNVCHHFNDSELKNLLKKLLKHAKFAIVINDLHRHFIPYFFIKLITRLFGLSMLARHDGPLSVLRSFRRHELLDVVTELNLSSFNVKWCWPFRWLVVLEV